MIDILKKGWLKVSIIVVISLLLLLSFTFWFFHIYSKQDMIAYLYMDEIGQPIWKDLALRRIGSGQNVADVIQLHPPLHIEKWKNYTWLIYQKPVGPDEYDTTGIFIMAKNDKLIYAVAFGGGFKHDFFCSITKDELDEIDHGYSEYLKNIREAKKANKNNNSPAEKIPEK